MKKAIYLLLLLLIVFTGCSKEEEKAQNNKQRDSSTEEKAVPDGEEEAEKALKNIFPLTGMKTDEEADNRIIGIMVNNHTLARPQSGLSSADMVFEILAEGKITRLLALYQSKIPDVVGPVRSAREYYFKLANAYNALYVYHGAANFVNDMIINRGIEHLNGSIYDNDGNLFKREAFRKAPHNSYLQVDAVYDVAEGKGYEVTSSFEGLEFLDEKEVVSLSGEPANHVEIVYSANNPMEIVEFAYDEASGKYTRFNDREKTVELNTDEAVQVENIFIVETHHEVIDDAGRRAIDLASGGNAYLIQKGNVQKVQWENQDGKIIPVIDGKPAGFVPGKTWINIIPSAPGIEQSVTISN
ncbi:lipoprotein YerB [Virgibacillus indicus]|uniref:Lipoprotein YerB n=1 Tax=Virgibacillus indicus TaxID=2024554 RepID=A0A265N6P2_9BACI|nr:DUF3048 domain-containing protein [Virgibacillus indicus]OZU87680.1 lipoprotein YerB [Virgibacillus indicus]